MSSPHGFRGSFFTDFPTRAAYSEGAGPYRIVPRAVAVPAGLEDLQHLVRHAASVGESLTPRGAGSGIPGNNVGPGIVVDLCEFAMPLVVSPRGLANVGAAVTWAALDHAAGRLAFRLGPNPSSGNVCTIGGMVATNASGARSLRSGSVRRWVRGVEMVTADGEVGWFGRKTATRNRRTPAPGEERSLDQYPAACRRFQADVRPQLLGAAEEISSSFPQTRKNSSGYALPEYLRSGDLLDLIIGSEGTLGIVTRVALELEHAPWSVSSALLALDDVNRLPELVAGLGQLNPAAIELLDRSLLTLAGPRIPFPLEGIDAVLLVDFERESQAAAEAAVTAARTRLASQCVRFEAALSQHHRERLWAVRHAASPTLASLPHGRRSLQVIEDGCVPVAELGRYLQGVRAAARRLDLEIVAFGHAGDGHLHVNALVDPERPDLEQQLSALLKEVTSLIVKLGGTLSGEHGDGRLRAPLLQRIYGKRIIGLFGEVKRAFDPKGILNPGVVLPDRAAATAPLAALKVGTNAQPIPLEVERRLREVERTSGWSVPKHELARHQMVTAR